MALALVRDLREHRVPASAEELADFETDVLAGFVLARASAGLADSTIRNDTGHLDLISDWFGRPLWQMQPADAAIQELLGHSWTGTTARYIHVHDAHVEDAWVAGQQRAADRWKGLAR